MENIGVKIKNRRLQLGLSLDKVSAKTGVSKAMLGQIERGESNPTVGVLWKVATGLEISFSSLLEPKFHNRSKHLLIDHKQSQAVFDSDGIEAYTLVPFDSVSGMEVMLVSLEPHSTHISTPHSMGVVEHVLPLNGVVEIKLAKTWKKVQAGQALKFSADQPHGYRNPGDKKVSFHNLIFYP